MPPVITGNKLLKQQKIKGDIQQEHIELEGNVRYLEDTVDLDEIKFLQMEYQNMKKDLGTTLGTTLTLFTQCIFNPFWSSVTFLYSLKTSENLWFFDVFRAYRNGTLD